MLAWSRIPDTTKESWLEFCLYIAGAGARVSKGALLLKTPWTQTFTHGLSLRTEAICCCFQTGLSALCRMLSQGSPGPPGTGQTMFAVWAGDTCFGDTWLSGNLPGSASAQQCREVRAAGTRGTRLSSGCPGAPVPSAAPQAAPAPTLLLHWPKGECWGKVRTTD